MIDANIYWYTYSYNILINALQLLKPLREALKGILGLDYSWRVLIIISPWPGVEGGGFLPVGSSVLRSVSRAPGKPASAGRGIRGRGGNGLGGLWAGVSRSGTGSKKVLGQKKKKKKICGDLATVTVPAGLRHNSP